MLATAGFKIVRHQAYSHIITFEYFLRKLAALGVRIDQPTPEQQDYRQSWA